MKIKNYSLWALCLCFLSMSISFSLASNDHGDQTVKAIQHARKSHNIHLKRAVQMIDQTEKGNRRDLQYLFRNAARGLKAKRRHGLDVYNQFIQDVCARLKHDQQRLSLYQERLQQDTSDSEENVILRTALKKLLGFTNGVGNSFSGIYTDSIDLLQSNRIDFHSHKIDGMEPKHNQITVLKNVLIYINLMLAQKQSIAQMPSLLEHIQLLYPAPFSKNVSINPEEKEIGLFGYDQAQQATLFVPNAGYVYGGRICYNAKNQALTHGVDCSSLLFWATHYADYPTKGFVEPCSTKGAAMAWCVLKNQKFEEQLQLSAEEIYQKLQESADKFILEHYLPVEVSNLQDGDLVVWRKFDPAAQSYVGHIVMFAGWIDAYKSSFIGIEATRKDDKTVEGLQFNHFMLTQELSKTYVLRAKPQ